MKIRKKIFSIIIKSRKYNSNLTPHSQFETLILFAQSTDDGNRPDTQLFTELYSFLLYLLGQFPSGRQYDRVRSLVRILHTGWFINVRKTKFAWRNDKSTNISYFSTVGIKTF